MDGKIYWETLIKDKTYYLSRKHNASMNAIVLVEKSESYIFFYDNESRTETLRVLGRCACNPEMSFTWNNAAVLSQRIREEYKRQDRSIGKLDLTRRFKIRKKDE